MSQFATLVGSSSSEGDLAGGAANATMSAAIGADKGCLPSMPVKQRIMGFVACFTLGLILSFISSFLLVTGNLTGFAVLYTIGNLTALFSTGFLIGPMRQVKNMFARKRAIVSAVYIVTMISTLAVAFTIGSVVLIILLIIIQFCALVWYTLSYIPYGRDIAWRWLKGCWGG